MIEVFKIFEVRDELPTTLFHGWNGSRKLLLDTNLIAENKEATDGSRSTTYKSGFHSYEDLKAVIEWSKGIVGQNRKHRYVCKVNIDDFWYKPNAIRRTYLSNILYIDSRDWRNRLRLDVLLQLGYDNSLYFLENN